MKAVHKAFFDPENERAEFFQDGNYLCSVRWIDTVRNANCLSIGLESGLVALFDAVKEKLIRTIPQGKRLFSQHRFQEQIETHNAVLSQDWNHYLLAAGFENGDISIFDMRKKQAKVNAWGSRDGAVISVRWSPDKLYLASSSENPAKNVAIWCLGENRAILDLGGAHVGPVKALSWCPWKRRILATGGGHSDKTIKIWDCNTVSNSGHGTTRWVKSVQTSSGVEDLLWNKDQENEELLSAHDFPKGELQLWSFPNFQNLGSLSCGKKPSSVLSVCKSPVSQLVVTASTDEILRFWKVFNLEQRSRKKTSLPVMLRENQIR